jgi:signal transduction histidine kinase
MALRRSSSASTRAWRRWFRRFVRYPGVGVQTTRVLIKLTTAHSDAPPGDVAVRPHRPITMRSVRETSRAPRRSPLDRVAERLLLLPRARWSGYVFGVAAVALATGLLGPVMNFTRLANSSAVYTIPVLLTAALYGRGPALATSVAAFVAYDALFSDPAYPHSLTSPREWLTLFVFVITAVVAGQLAAMLRQQARQARQREREAMALYEVARLVPGSTLELQPLLGLILDQLNTIVEYDAAAIILRDAADEAVVFDYRGALPREQVIGLRVQTGSALGNVLDEVGRRREPMLVEDLGGQSLIAQNLATTGMSVPPATAHSELAVPLVVKEQVIGVQTLLHSTSGYYTTRHAELATMFAQQAAVAIENARLYARVRGTAALEERQRLARELHDSVSQALYGILLNASTADELFEAAPDQAHGLVRDVLGLAEGGLAELRALIFELRPESLEREGLVGALEKQAAAVQARHGLHVRMQVAGEPDLPQAAKEAVYRVAQEALHNAVKHARAHTLDLHLELGDGEVGLVVADDGRGFDTGREFPGHLGLQSMRERAAAVGGTLEIQSAPGEGTRLRARFPLAAHS